MAFIAINYVTEYGDRPSINYSFDGTIPILPTLEVDGYEFLGWYSTETFEDGTKVEVGDTITSDITLYAKWRAIVVSVNSKMTAIADKIRELSGTTGAMSLDAMASNINEANNDIDTQADLISQIANVLDGKRLPIQQKSIIITENGTVEVAPDDGYTLSNVVITVDVSNSGIDPSEEYQRVEYITSAEEGTYPYIITDFIADNACGLEVIASFPVMQDRIPMGSRLDSGTTRFYCAYPLSTSSCYYGFNDGYSISCPTTINTIYILQTNFLNSRLVNIYDADGIRLASSTISSSVKLTEQTVPVSIFGYNYASNGAVTSKREYKLYGARCSRGHEVVREYIPCYRKSDGEIGLYEKITGQFLTNQGGGTFTKGADIEW